MHLRHTHARTPQEIEEEIDDLNERLCHHEGKLELLTGLLADYLHRYHPDDDPPPPWEHP